MSGKGKQTSKKGTKVAGTEASPECDDPATATPGIASATSAPAPASSGPCLPILKVSENEKLVPRYANILQRNSEEGIGMEDLDALQLDLEILLSSVVVRGRVLHEEMSNLSSAEERRDRRSKSGKGLLEKRLGPEGKPGKAKDAKAQSLHTSKPLKQRTVKSSNSGAGPNHLVPNPHEPVRVEGSKSDVPILNLPTNETLNKFWNSVNPFCADIQANDIQLLESLAATHGDISEFKKIAPLGRHYTLLWAHSDLMQEEEASSEMNPNGSRDKKKARSDVAMLLAKASDNKSNDMAGPLTQRLVSALMEENVYAGNNNVDSKIFRDGDPPVLRDLTIQNSMNLEMRMHKELVDQVGGSFGKYSVRCIRELLGSLIISSSFLSWFRISVWDCV